jgi:acetyl-CoA acetyltransferase
MSTQSFIKDRAAIVGIGQTQFGKALPQSEEELAAAAIKAALDDAGLDPGEVDGLCSFAMQATDEEVIARNLGMGDLRFFARTPAGGGGGAAIVGLGAMAVATKQADVVVAWRSRKRSAKSSRVWAQTQERVAGRMMWSSPSGLIRPADEIAMLARRHMHEYGTTREHLANVALTFRAHANRNPHAVMYDKPLTREEYFAARMISEPLCLFDCCVETDGALAVVLVSSERARDLRQKPAYIHAFAQGISSGSVMMSNYFSDDPLRTQAWTCAEALWSASDIKAKDIHVAQIYDAFTPEVVLSLEGYGFCERGAGGAFTEQGNITLGGRLPLNTAGGSLSEVYVHGLNLVLEAVRQIRGTSTAQLPNVATSFVSSSDGVPTSALVLRR